MHQNHPSIHPSIWCLFLLKPIQGHVPDCEIYVKHMYQTNKLEHGLILCAYVSLTAALLRPPAGLHSSTR